jgi:hypothetical protein
MGRLARGPTVTRTHEYLPPRATLPPASRSGAVGSGLDSGIITSNPGPEGCLPKRDIRPKLRLRANRSDDKFGLLDLTEPAAASPRFWASPAGPGPGRLREMGTVQAESAGQGARTARGRQKGSDSVEDSWLEEVL